MKKNARIYRFLVLFGIALLSLIATHIFIDSTSKASNEKAQIEAINQNKQQTRQVSLERLTHKLENYLLENSTTSDYTTDLKEDVLSWLQNEFQAQPHKKNQLTINDMDYINNIDLHTVPFSDTVFNFILSKDSFSTDRKKTTKFQTLTFDTETQSALHLEDFIQNDRQNRATLKALLVNEGPEEVSIDNELLEQSLTNFAELKWTITPNAFTLYWDAYEVADVALQVDISFEHLDKLAVTSRLEPYIPEKETTLVKVLSKETLNPNGKYIALTFDDGPDPDITPRVLDILQQQNVVATFYLLGSCVIHEPELVERMVAEGHELGNHTFNHMDVSKADYASISEEIQKTNDSIFNAAGIYPLSLRTPFGAMSPAAEAVAEAYGLPIVMWSADSRDWESRNPAAIHERVMSKAAPGGIVLLHDVHSTTADALPSIISSLRNQGYEFVTVSQILAWQDATGIGPHFGQQAY